MELRQLRYFISAATHLNFTRAAKECFIVQTAMTQQMANLEKELGVRLFERQTRGLALTQAGELFLQEAKEILSRTEKAEEKVRSLQQDYTGLLRIGFHGEMFREDLNTLLRRLRIREPGIKVMPYQLPCAGLIEGLRDGQLDVAILPYRASFETEPWLEWEILEEDGVMLALSASHPLAAKESVTLKEIEDLPIIDFDKRADVARDVQMAREGRKGKNYGVVLDHASMEILLHSGYAASFWMRRMCSPERYPGIRFLPISDYSDTEKVALAWRRDACTPEIEQLRALVREHYEKRE